MVKLFASMDRAFENISEKVALNFFETCFFYIWMFNQNKHIFMFLRLMYNLEKWKKRHSTGESGDADSEIRWMTIVDLQ